MYFVIDVFNEKYQMYLFNTNDLLIPVASVNEI